MARTVRGNLHGHGAFVVSLLQRELRASMAAKARSRLWWLGLGAGLSLTGLLLGAGGASAEVKGAAGVRSLGTVVNGVKDGSCTAGLCGVSGGTGAGKNLFHRFVMIYS